MPYVVLSFPTPISPGSHSCFVIMVSLCRYCSPFLYSVLLLVVSVRSYVPFLSLSLLLSSSDLPHFSTLSHLPYFLIYHFVLHDTYPASPFFLFICSLIFSSAHVPFYILPLLMCFAFLLFLITFTYLLLRSIVFHFAISLLSMVLPTFSHFISPLFYVLCALLALVSYLTWLCSLSCTTSFFLCFILLFSIVFILFAGYFLSASFDVIMYVPPSFCTRSLALPFFLSFVFSSLPLSLSAFSSFLYCFHYCCCFLLSFFLHIISFSTFSITVSSCFLLGYASSYLSLALYSVFNLRASPSSSYSLLRRYITLLFLPDRRLSSFLFLLSFLFLFFYLTP